MILTEFTRVIAKVTQEFRKRWSTRAKVGRATGQLWRNHARAKRMHPSEERVASGCATLFGVISHEDRAFIANTVNIWSLADHQPTMVNTRLHPADVISHNEDNVRFFLLCLGCRCHGRS